MDFTQGVNSEQFQPMSLQVFVSQDNKTFTILG